MPAEQRRGITDNEYREGLRLRQRVAELEAEVERLREEIRWAEDALGIDTLGGLPTWGTVKLVGRRLRAALTAAGDSQTEGENDGG